MPVRQDKVAFSPSAVVCKSDFVGKKTTHKFTSSKLCCSLLICNLRRLDFLPSTPPVHSSESRILKAFLMPAHPQFLQPWDNEKQRYLFHNTINNGQIIKHGHTIILYTPKKGSAVVRHSDETAKPSILHLSHDFWPLRGNTHILSIKKNTITFSNVTTLQHDNEWLRARKSIMFHHWFSAICFLHHSHNHNLMVQPVQEHWKVFDHPNQLNLVISDSSDTCGIITIASALLTCSSSLFSPSIADFQLIFCLGKDPPFTLFCKNLVRRGPVLEVLP